MPRKKPFTLLGGIHYYVHRNGKLHGSLFHPVTFEELMDDFGNELTDTRTLVISEGHPACFGLDFSGKTIYGPTHEKTNYIISGLFGKKHCDKFNCSFVLADRRFFQPGSNEQHFAKLVELTTQMVSRCKLKLIPNHQITLSKSMTMTQNQLIHFLFRDKKASYELGKCYVKNFNPQEIVQLMFGSKKEFLKTKYAVLAPLQSCEKDLLNAVEHHKKKYRKIFILCGAAHAVNLEEKTGVQADYYLPQRYTVVQQWPKHFKLIHKIMLQLISEKYFWNELAATF